MNVFKKSKWKPSYNDGDDSANFTKRLVTEDVKRGNSVTSVVVLMDVDSSKDIADMPTIEEYDLEEQLNAGVKPQQINVRGVLGGTPDLQGMINSVTEPFEGEFEKSVIEDVKPNNND